MYILSVLKTNRERKHITNFLSRIYNSSGQKRITFQFFLSSKSLQPFTNLHDFLRRSMDHPKFVQHCWFLTEQGFKLIPGPRNGMFYSSREWLERAVRDRLLWGVLLVPVRLCQVGYDDLNVTFWPEGARLHQRLLISHATTAKKERHYVLSKL